MDGINGWVDLPMKKGDLCNGYVGLPEGKWDGNIGSMRYFKGYEGEWNMNGICMVEKSQAAVENDGKHPIIGFNHLSLVDFATGWWGGWDQWILKFPRDGLVC